MWTVAAKSLRNLKATKRRLYEQQDYGMVIKSRRMRWRGNVASMVGMRNAYNILVVRTEGMQPVKG
jgi:hypothetical protein